MEILKLKLRYLLLSINLFYLSKVNCLIMNFIKKIGLANLFILALCVFIIGVAEYLFQRGDKLHAIFIGLWAPTLLLVAIFIKQIKNGR